MEMILIPPSDLELLIRKILVDVLDSMTFGSTDKDEKPITQNELASFLGVTVETLIKWKAKGKIPYLQLGSKVFYLKSKVISALEIQDRRLRKVA
jgi:excisionase family DNA binding protein